MFYTLITAEQACKIVEASDQNVATLINDYSKRIEEAAGKGCSSLVIVIPDVCHDRVIEIMRNNGYDSTECVDETTIYWGAADLPFSSER